ncbi:MAG: hypothetical protein KIT56_07505 [Gammaproteobacteria bacterium]|nr:hypothetical protein [Gammaproteobacteria bacterium]MCW5583706.1 hypothetical protein [Gammaproteobacteria bacterium]
MRKTWSSGMVLITVLVFLQIFSLLSLYSLTYLSQSMKRYSHQWQSHLYQRTSNKILRQLEDVSMVTSTRCRIPMIPSTELKIKDATWWQSHACSGNLGEIRYHYAVEFLGIDPCGMIVKSHHAQSSISKYYRITLYLLPEAFHGKFIMQSTVALPEEGTTVLCQDKLHRVQQGRQMWREI